MSRAVRIGSGAALVVLGTLMLVLPGPGVLTIVGGLALLRRDVPAADRALAWLRDRLPRGSVPQAG